MKLHLYHVFHLVEYYLFGVFFLDGELEFRARRSIILRPTSVPVTDPLALISRSPSQKITAEKVLLDQIKRLCQVCSFIRIMRSIWSSIMYLFVSNFFRRKT